MKKKILSIFLTLALILTVIPFTGIISLATSDDCLMYGCAFEWIESVPATCTTDGYDIIKCSVCGFTDTLEYTATGHIDWDKDESCDDCGEFMPATTGKCGDNLTWTYYKSSEKLSISGSGDMYEYTVDNRPWKYFADNVTTISIGVNVAEICDYAFYGFKAATSATIYDNGVTTIGDYAFYNCESLSSITIPSIVTSIGENAFYGCSSLTNVYYEDIEDNWNAITIGNNNQPLLDATIHCKILDSGACGDNLTWVFDERTNTLTISGAGAMYDYGSNNRPWEDYEDIIQELVINDSVTTIGDYAAYSCSKLAIVTIPDSVITIGDSSFSGCRFNQVTIGNSVTTIGENAFSICNYLSRITIPESVKAIGAGAFYSCTSLRNVYYTGFIQDWKKITIGDNNSRLLNATMHYKETDSGICGDNLTWVYDEPTSSLTISGTGAMYDYSYSNRPWENYEENIKEIVIADGVTTIGVSAFYSCQALQSITIPSSVTTIGDDVFTNCTSLTSITVDSNNQYYSSDEYGVLFNKDKTTLLQYPAGNTRTRYLFPITVTTVADEAFKSCTNITDINYTSSSDDWEKISIGKHNDALVNAKKHYNYAVSGTCGDNLTWVFDESTGILTISGTGAMYDYWNNQPWRCCNSYIKEIVIADGVTTIGCYAFGHMSYFTSITIPNSVTTIDSYAFYFCDNIANVTIPDSVTTIGQYAFLACNSLTNITIPDSVTTIGQYAFRMCENLTNITVDSNNKNYSNDKYGVLFNKDKTTLIQYPTGKANTSYTIPDSVTTIENDAFDYCHLTNVTFGKGVTTIGYREFYHCDNLTKVTVDSNNEYFSNDEYGVLFNKNKTTLVYYPKGNTITSYAIPNSVTKIADNAFYACENLTDITIPDSVMTIGDYAFYYCTNLKNMIIPDGVTTINYYTFGACWNLFSVTIPSSVTTICENAFSSCEYLGSVYGTVFYSGTEEEWNEISIEENGNELLLNAQVVYNYTPPFTGIKDNHFYKNDVMQKAYQLVEFDSDFYYIADCHKIVKNKTVYITAERTNGLKFADGTPIPAGNYKFDENGKMVVYNGLVGDYVYKNGVKLKAYQLAEVDGSFYYIADCHKIVKNKTVYITAERINGLTFADGTPITAGNYKFDENGKMIIYNGIINDYVYKNGAQLKAYQLVEVDGDFYYVADRHQIVKNKTVYITAERINGLTFADGTPITAGNYKFDENGKMIIYNGIINDYVYKNGAQLKAYQLVEIDGDFYYIADRHQIVKNKTVYITAERTNGLTFADGTPIKAGSYEFDENGKMIIE
ncbi:MAG: leucine-rich repeat domain-containing protein [Clostridia bacterium]|nr:leucine-rich repeat domain-containing protein [Clostridia bacterium]